MPLYPQGNKGVKLQLSRCLGKTSKFSVVQAELPLGLSIAQLEDENGYLVEMILPMGTVAMGKANILEGDVVHAVTTSKDGGKIAVLATEIESNDEMAKTIVGNSDGMITLVIEREGSGSDNAFGFVNDIVRMI